MAYSRCLTLGGLVIFGKTYSNVEPHDKVEMKPVAKQISFQGKFSSLGLRKA
ncbi:hypothetical protein [Chamaesiphon minutus]|uniref:hypothetical protein n=1 Tax=Chamaesiphon minutus TaxID=1173032 RepID=UPI0012F7F21F|nr:hypothetical protein [Chamaesiphon minutus]